MRLTLSDAVPAVAQTLNLNKSGDKPIYYINRACEELLDIGRCVGTVIKYRVRCYDRIITWPREIQTIEAMSLNGGHIDVQNKWYQFLDTGADFRPYWTGGDWSNGFWNCGGGVAIDQSEAISFRDVCGAGNPKKLKVYGTATEAAGARILLQFYDNAGNYVRTNDGTEGWTDGEFVNIDPTTPQTTINSVSSWVGVQKPMTNGVVRITELDTVTNLERLLAVYEPSETNPSYRRSYVPQFWSNNQQCPRCIIIMGKTRFIPALKPRDYLAISCLSAIIYKAKSIYLYENNNLQQAAAMDQKAFQVLDAQLSSWVGAGAIQTPNIDTLTTAQLGSQNFI